MQKILSYPSLQPLREEQKEQRLYALKGIFVARWCTIAGLGFLGILQRRGDVAIISLSWQAMVGLLALPTFLNILYGLYVYRSPHRISINVLIAVSLFQVLVDELMITMVVLVTGGIESISFVLYVLPLIEVAILYSEILILGFAFFTAILYSVLIVGEYFKIVPHFARYHFEPGFIGNTEITIGNTVSVALILMIVGIFLVFVSRIIRNREAQVTSERNKFNAIIRSLEDGIVLVDTHGTVLLLNPSAREMLRLPEYVQTVRLRSAIFPKELEELRVALLEQPSDRQIRKGLHIENPAASLALHHDIFPITSVRGRIIAWVHVLKDMTREKELDQIKSDFISIAAHQLRTPLSGLKWFFKMMLDGDAGAVTKQQRGLLEKAFDRTNHVIEIVNNLLDVSELEEGRTPYHFAPEDPVRLVAEVVREAQLDAEPRRIIIALHLPKKPCAPIMADKQKLKVALENILDNAMKYSPPASTINVHVRRHENRKHMEIEVTDHGIGIPKEEQGKIFSKFFRGRNAKTQETVGSGLGMYIVKNIIAKHRGTITFTSEEGRGTSFTITLPFA